MVRPKHVTLIVAMDRDRLIGVDNKLPWHLPADLKHFKALTLGHHVIMGRKTFESILATSGGKPLPGRTSVIVTRQRDYSAPVGCVMAHSLSEALSAASADQEAFVIGGAELFAQTLPIAEKIHVTEVDTRIGYGDVYFPELASSHWREAAREEHEPDAKNRFRYAFVTYVVSKAV